MQAHAAHLCGAALPRTSSARSLTLLTSDLVQVLGGVPPGALLLGDFLQPTITGNIICALPAEQLDLRQPPYRCQYPS